MAKGLPKSIIKKYGISKKAWEVFRGQKGLNTPMKTSSSKPKEGMRKVAKRVYRKARHKSAGFSTRTVFKWLRIASLVANPVRIAMMPVPNQTKVTYAVQDFTGYNLDDGSFDASRLVRGWGPYLVTTLVTYGIPKLAGIIRKL